MMYIQPVTCILRVRQQWFDSIAFISLKIKKFEFAYCPREVVGFVRRIYRNPVPLFSARQNFILPDTQCTGTYVKNVVPGSYPSAGGSF